MKIVVLHRYPPKQVVGTNASFIYFLEKLTKAGHEVYYLTYKDPDGDESFIDIKGLTYLKLPFTFSRGNYRDKVLKTYLWMLLAPVYMLFFRMKHKLDLIYCDDSVPYYGFLTKVLNPGTKVIVRIGDLQIGYELADDKPWLYKLMLKIEVMMWKVLDGLIPISKAFKDFIIDQGINQSKMKVVEESIDIDKEKVKHKKLKKKVDDVTFIFHGSIAKCKGIKVLVEAFRKVMKVYDNSNLIIAGGGGEEEMIKNYVKEENIKNIRFTGWYNHQKLVKYMLEADIGVVMRSPNIANNFVVTTCLLENWKFGKPVLVPQLKSFEGVIKNHENGVFYSAGDAGDLSDKMIYMIENKTKWKKLVVNGRKTARNKFDSKKIAYKMVKALEDLTL